MAAFFTSSLFVDSFYFPLHSFIPFVQRTTTTHWLLPLVRMCVCICVRMRQQANKRKNKSASPLPHASFFVNLFHPSWRLHQNNTDKINFFILIFWLAKEKPEKQTKSIVSKSDLIFCSLLCFAFRFVHHLCVALIQHFHASLDDLFAHVEPFELRIYVQIHNRTYFERKMQMFPRS